MVRSGPKSSDGLGPLKPPRKKAPQIAAIPMPKPIFENSPVLFLLVVLVPSLALLFVGLFSLSLVVAVVEGQNCMN